MSIRVTAIQIENAGLFSAAGHVDEKGENVVEVRCTNNASAIPMSREDIRALLSRIGPDILELQETAALMAELKAASDQNARHKTAADEIGRALVRLKEINEALIRLTNEKEAIGNNLNHLETVRKENPLIPLGEIEHRAANVDADAQVLLTFNTKQRILKDRDYVVYIKSGEFIAPELFEEE
jgi:hypothetical protein